MLKVWVQFIGCLAKVLGQWPPAKPASRKTLQGKPLYAKKPLVEVLKPASLTALTALTALTLNTSMLKHDPWEQSGESKRGAAARA
jgi:hypothetical protein